MTTYSAQTDESALALIGKRLAAFRIRNNWTQAQLAEQSGVSKGTIERIERGDSVQIVNFIKVLRACGMLESFLSVFPNDLPSPMQLLYMGKIKNRKRASTPRKNTASILKENSAEYNAGDQTNGTPQTPWVWDEDK
ncbi:helix-turn-helix transcriptional regulator [Fibrobacter sp. UBA4297]|uniref:helix-turn-helix domain-containing protein n=1 Tax=Fibrobacter sp. UBA4297 TaxID=1946536 RepID=UPI0025B7E44D|nr:helix-turn-helix transcriptional regulator [Fibrobacter sp. UBA4297]